MLAYARALGVTYYAQNYASIIRQPLIMCSLTVIIVVVLTDQVLQRDSTTQAHNTHFVYPALFTFAMLLATILESNVYIKPIGRLHVGVVNKTCGKRVAKLH